MSQYRYPSWTKSDHAKKLIMLQRRDVVTLENTSDEMYFRKQAKGFIKKSSRNEEGAVSVEYALIAFLIAAAVIVPLTAMGLRIGIFFCLFLTKIGSSCT